MAETIRVRFITADGIIGDALVPLDGQGRPPREWRLPVRVRHTIASEWPDLVPLAPLPSRIYEIVRWSPLDPGATLYEEVVRG